MTYLQPHQEKNIFKTSIVILLTIVFVVALYLIALYMRIVNLEHDTTSVKSKTKEITIESADLQNRLFELLQEDRLRAFAIERGLVEEKTPKYFHASREWLFATQY